MSEQQDRSADSHAENRAQPQQVATPASISAAAPRGCGVTAFFVFSSEQRDLVKQALEKEAVPGSKVSVGAIAKRIGELWKALSDDDKARYKAIALENKAKRAPAAEGDAQPSSEAPASLPLATVKRVVLLDSDVKRVAGDAVKALAAAAQLFLESLAERAGGEAARASRTSIAFHDVKTAMRRWKPVGGWPESPFLEIENVGAAAAASARAATAAPKALAKAAEKHKKIDSFFSSWPKGAVDAQ